MPKLLVVAASPLDQDRLRLAAEVKEIRKALERSVNREQWEAHSNEATTVDELRQALLSFRPTVLHFAGHGSEGGLCFETPDGGSHQTDTVPLARLLHIFRDHLKCVVLNACFSEAQGKLIQEEIDYVVGMKSAIADDAASRFAVAFYEGLFAGSDFRTAFDLGCSALELHQYDDAQVPQFLTTLHQTATTLVYSAEVPEVERFLLAYLNTPFADRAKFTTAGDDLTPVLKRFYGDQMLHAIRRVRVRSMDQMFECYWRVLAELSVGRQSHSDIYYVRIEDRTVRLEWEATAGLWSVPPTTYLALGSEGAGRRACRGGA